MIPKTYFVWYLVELTKIHILGWLETWHQDWIFPNLALCTLNSSLLYRDMIKKCHQVIPTQLFFWLIQLKKLRLKLKNTLFLVDNKIWKLTENLVQIWILIFLVLIWISFYQTILSLIILKQSIRPDECWLQKLKEH